MDYWDTSMLAKLYFGEPDSAAFVTHLSTNGPAVASELAGWEMFRVAARKEAEGFIGANTAESVFNRFQADAATGKVMLIPMDDKIEKQYRALALRLHRMQPPVYGRTLDCIHLATADLIGAQEIVVTDIGLRKAAVALGFKVFPK